jgi:hypothetical protein
MQWEAVGTLLMVALGQQTGAEEEAHLAHGIVLAVTGRILIWNTRTGSTSFSAPTRTPLVPGVRDHATKNIEKMRKNCKKKHEQNQKRKNLGTTTMLILTRQVSSEFKSSALRPSEDTK